MVLGVNTCFVILTWMRLRVRNQPPSSVTFLLTNHIFNTTLVERFGMKIRHSRETRRGRKDVWKRARNARREVLDETIDEMETTIRIHDFIRVRATGFEKGRLRSKIDMERKLLKLPWHRI